MTNPSELPPCVEPWLKETAGDLWALLHTNEYQHDYPEILRALQYAHARGVEKGKQEAQLRREGEWEDAHRELLDAVMACCDPENKVCGLREGQERLDLEEVISRHHTIHSVDGPHIDTLTIRQQPKGESRD